MLLWRPPDVAVRVIHYHRQGDAAEQGCKDAAQNNSEPVAEHIPEPRPHQAVDKDRGGRQHQQHHQFGYQVNDGRDAYQ